MPNHFESNQLLYTTITVFLAASAIYLLAGNAYAADPAPAGAGEAMGFLAFDKNGDGFIDVKEATANPDLEKKFDAVDTDKDGRISMEEYNKGFAMR